MPKLPPRKVTLESHLQKWVGGCGGDICKECRNVVLGRGEVPCDVLFVGMAPGESEDVSGKAFAGPAGHKLEEVIAYALSDALSGKGLRFTFTNLVGCIPRYDGQRKYQDPDHEDVMRCQPRLKEFIELCQPRLVFTVGKMPKEFFDRSYKHAVKLPPEVKVVNITHPSAILQANLIRQGVMFQRCTIQVRDALEEVFLSEKE